MPLGPSGKVLKRELVERYAWRRAAARPGHHDPGGDGRPAGRRWRSPCWPTVRSAPATPS